MKLKNIIESADSADIKPRMEDSRVFYIGVASIPNDDIDNYVSMIKGILENHFDISNIIFIPTRNLESGWQFPIGYKMRIKIDDFLTPEECQKFIVKPDKLKDGWLPASITTPSGAVIKENYRNNDRHMFDDPELANHFTKKLKSYIDDSDKEWSFCGLNERFKIYRYHVGQNFAMHTDAQYSRNDNERSFQTIIIYLNENYEGGETEFFGMDTIMPKTGLAVVFYHHLMHEGLPVVKGTKYALRTDVMYKKR